MIRPTRLAILVAIAVGGATLAPATVAAAETSRDSQTYLARLEAALDTCRDSYPRTDDAKLLIECVGKLAGPDPKNAAELDLFDIFTYCLFEAAGPDSMYPGIDDAEVNACLEKWGVY
jgi:hypothetical protein